VAAELALPALTVVFGLQLLRLMVATTVSVYRERLGASLTSLALFAVGAILLGLLAGPVVATTGTASDHRGVAATVRPAA
jgi:hypothetical protein